MKAILETFQRNLEDVRNLISLFEIEGRFVSQEFLEDEAPSSTHIELHQALARIYTRKRTFNYSVVVITLFGAFEAYFDDSIEMFVNEYASQYSKFSHLPERLKKSFFEHSLRQLAEKAGKLGDEEFILLKKLAKAIEEDSIIGLDSRPITNRTANLKKGVINEVITRVIEKNVFEVLRNSEDLKNIVRDQIGKDTIEEVTEVEIFQNLDRLAILRNAVAHKIPSEIESNSTLLKYLTYYECFSIGFTSFLQGVLDAEIIKLKGIPIGDTVAVYHRESKSIVIIRSNGISLNVGQQICGKTTEATNFYFIESIQVDEVDHEHVEDLGGREIGIMLNARCTDSQVFYSRPVPLTTIVDAIENV